MRVLKLKCKDFRNLGEVEITPCEETNVICGENAQGKTNLLEAIDDILTHYCVIEDDDAQHVGGHDGSRVLYDKENPRTEIYITTLDGNPIIV